MYQKILVPLDENVKEVDAILAKAQELLAPEGEGVLLHVIPPGEITMDRLIYKSASQDEKERRSKATGYLRYIADGLNRSSGSWRYDVVVSRSVADAIVDLAGQERVDLIAMSTYSRKGLARWFKGSVAEQVRAKASGSRAPIEVLVLGPRDLAPA